MKNIQQWIEELEQQGVVLALVGGQLQIDAPNSLLVPALVEQLKARREELIDALDDSSENAISRLPEDIRSGPLPLSFAQERLWFLDQFESASSLYNIPLCVRLSGQLDVDALRNAIELLVVRHEVLRTSIVKDATDSPQQIITNATPTLGLKTISADESSLQALQIAEASIPFDLSDSLKIRATLADIQDRKNEYILLVTMHHIASDGWSVEILVSELSEFYSATIEKREATLTELPVQYADFGAWQRTWLNAGQLQDQTSYWKGQLEGAPALIDLPLDHPRPSSQQFVGSTLEFSVSHSLTKRLQDLSKDNRATLYMTLLSAFNVLLSRYGAGEDIIVGSPIANRTQEETELLIGFFVNTLVLRSDLSGEPTFLELLGRVRETTLTAFQYQDVPFEKLVEQLQPARSTSYSPLFQVLFMLQNQPESSMRMPDLNIEPLNVTNHTAKFDLTLGLQETSDGMTGWIEYSTDLFDSSTIERMSRHLLILLEGIVENPECSISTLPLIEESERRYLLNEMNAVDLNYPHGKTMVDLFVDKALQVPDAIAVIGPNERQLSFKELDKQSNQLARYLQSLGVAEGDRVGIYLERDIEMVSALLGVMKSGALYVPLDPLFPPERLAFMAADANLKVVVTQQNLLDSVPSSQCLQVVLDNLDESYSDISDAPIQLSTPESSAYVIYTSGSTGQPKGVQVSHRSLQNFLCSMQQRPGLSSTDRLLAVTTLSFDIAGLELYLPLVVGARVVLCSQEQSMDPSALSARLESSGATVMQATPASWKMLLEWGWQGAKSLRVLCGGEPLSRDLADRLLECCGELWNLYGPTETTIWSTVSQISAGDEPITVGRPIANTQVYVLDEQMGVQPQGVSGELYIGGDGVAQGYLGRQELTAERFVVDPFSTGTDAKLYRTGDRARWRTNGELEIQGRLDDQVKLRGYRIEPGEIRAVLVHEPQIRDAVVVVREDGQAGSQLVAYVVTETETGKSDEPGEPLSVERMRELLKHKVPEYMVPSVWMQLEKLPLTPNGKVDKQQLPAPQGQQAPSAGQRLAQTENEKRIASVWSQILGVDTVRVDANLFELGGHSLLAVRLVSKLRSELGMEVPLLDLFQGMTVADMARHLDDGIREDISAADTRSCRLMTAVGKYQPFFMAGSNPRYAVAIEQIDVNQPVYQLDAYALQHIQYANGESKHSSIEALAKAFVRDIKQVQPVGPYCLGGGCEGALIAFEIALQLQQQGDEIVKLILWHTPPPGPNLKHEFGGSTARRMWWQVQAILAKGSLKEIGIRGYQELIRHEIIEYSLFSSMFRYRPGMRFNGDLDVVILEPNDGEVMIDGEPFYEPAVRGWQSTITGEVRSQHLTGTHDTWLRDHADVFGRYLESQLRTLREHSFFAKAG